ncbi:hypothetical protein MA9V2_043 [Chryseobacterium phage MA9V-2]|nr:hypothetical protein MA9V2_043 [Chryseobacterium phage MA9V-2]
MSKRNNRIANNKEWHNYQEALATVNAYKSKREAKQNERSILRHLNNAWPKDNAELLKLRKHRLANVKREYAELRYHIDHVETNEINKEFYEDHILTLRSEITNYLKAIYY